MSALSIGILVTPIYTERTFLFMLFIAIEAIVPIIVAISEDNIAIIIVLYRALIIALL